jgi:hypothetical protein
MIEQEFDVNNIASVDFGISLLDGEAYIVPTDNAIQASLREMLRSTAAIIGSKDDEWVEFSVSEEYSKKRKIYCPRNSEFMEAISEIYDIVDIPDKVFNLSEIVRDVRYYFAIFRDANHNKLVALKRATQFKGILKNRLISIFDNTLKIVDEEILRLDFNFDLIICCNNVYIEDINAFEALAYLGEMVAAAAEGKLAHIEQIIQFLDLSGIASSIENHPRTAKLAASVASRNDLAAFDREKIESLARAQGILLQVVEGNRLRPKVADRHKLLEILDDRRYVSNLTTADPIPFRARSRQRV